MTLPRIEAALARLEAAVQRPRRETNADAGPELARLEASNTRLREAVSLSLRQIDALIAEHAPAPQV